MGTKHLRNTAGFTLIEVAIASGLVAIAVLGATEYSAYTAKAFKSNDLTNDFYSLTSTLDSVFKTAACDLALKNLPLDVDALASAAQLVEEIKLNGYSIAKSGSRSPSSPGLIIKKMSFTSLLKKDVQVSGNYSQNIVNFELNAVKVDAQGAPMPGASNLTKDFVLTLWVDKNNGHLINQPCSYGSAPAFTNPLHLTTGSCLGAGQGATFSWDSVGATSATFVNWDGTKTAVNPSTSSYAITLPSTPGTYTFEVDITNMVGQVQPSTLNVDVFGPPIVNGISVQGQASTSITYTTSAVPGGPLVVNWSSSGWPNPLPGTQLVTFGDSAGGVVMQPPLSNTGGPTTLGSYPATGTHVYSLTANAGCGQVTTINPAFTITVTGCGGGCDMSLAPNYYSDQFYADACGNLVCKGSKPKCTPNCSTAATICSGTPFPDGCGGTCTGTMLATCDGSSTCTGTTATGTCGKSCPGTKTCGPGGGGPGSGYYCQCNGYAGDSFCSLGDVSGTPCVYAGAAPGSTYVCSPGGC
jgi:hypothetical protein